MGYAKKLQKRLLALSDVPNNARQKRRDKMNQAGVHKDKQRATFSTHVKGSNKKPNSGSQPPKGW